MTLVQSIPELMFVCNAVASRVKNGVYSLVSDKDGSEIEDNALWNKITANGPNWQYKFDEFIWHAVMHRLATGNRYGFSFSPSTRKLKHETIMAFWLLPPHYTTPKMKLPRPSYLTTLSASDYIEFYEYFGGGQGDKFTPEYITHDIFMKMGDSSDIISGKGVSPFKAGEYPLSNLVAVYAARNVIYVKRGPLGAIVGSAKDDAGSVALTTEQKDEAIQDLIGRFGFGQNQMPFAFTGQPIDYKKFGSTIQELEPFRETEASAAALCGIMGIPVSLMPKGAEAKFSNLDIGERNIYENVIFAEAESICKFLTNLGHFHEVGAHVVVNFDHVTCLQDDALKNAQALQANAIAANILFQNGHITENELRARIGEDAVEGGDSYVVGDNDSTIDLDDEDDKDESKAKKHKLKLIPKKLFGNKNHKAKKLNCFNHGTQEN